MGQLTGEMDIVSTLRAGKLSFARGLTERAAGGVLILTMPERSDPQVLAALNAALDQPADASAVGQRGVAVVALEEGGGEESFPASLADRLGLILDLRSIASSSMSFPIRDAEEMRGARARLPSVAADPEMIGVLCAAALALRVRSLRASWYAVQLARMSAAFHGRTWVEESDAQLAANFVLAPRASPQPAAPEEQPRNEESSQPSEPPSESREGEDAGGMEERIVAAAAVALPRGLMSRPARSTRRARDLPPGKSGAQGFGGARGSVAGTKRDRDRVHTRVNLFETLRVAAMYRHSRPALSGLCMRVEASDFRFSKFRQRTQSVTIFAVDASGSAAMARLAETKGAVELLLGDCYVRRDQVAVIGFRGQAAQILLPPTRSLVRARRALADLPGGGATPLAAAIDRCADLAVQVRRAGRTPTVVLLTDGRANVARDGTTGREAGLADAVRAARRLREMKESTLLIDTSVRASSDTQQLARQLGAEYLRMPAADSHALSEEVKRRSRFVA
jgi:magnesium chelatase subunit D